MSPEERTLHICYAFKQEKTSERQHMRFDLFLVILGVLLALAIVLTLLFGKEHSRHGYGVIFPKSFEQPHSLPFKTG